MLLLWLFKSNVWYNLDHFKNIIIRIYPNYAHNDIPTKRLPKHALFLDQLIKLKLEYSYNIFHSFQKFTIYDTASKKEII